MKKYSNVEVTRFADRCVVPHPVIHVQCCRGLSYEGITVEEVADRPKEVCFDLRLVVTYP